MQMVNGGFLRRPAYGFKLVDAAKLAASMNYLRLIAPSKCSTIFRRIKPASITCDLSTMAGCKPVADDLPPGTFGDGQDRKMFFLLRLAFWLGLVLVLLPRDKTPESEKLPQISVSDAVQAATAAVSDMSQFCKRQPQACEVGGQAATVIGVRAQDGARKIYRSVTDKKADEKKAEDRKSDDKKSEADKRAPDHTGSIGAAETDDPLLAEMAPRDTLTEQDLATDWHLPPAQ